MDLSRVVSVIFNVEKCRDLEIGVRGHSKSLKVAPFGRSCILIQVYWFVAKRLKYKINIKHK